MNSEFDHGLYYKITRLDNNNSILVLRDAAPPTMVSVGARWTTVNRPRRKSFITWDGNDPYRMDLPILFDGWDDLDSVESDVAILNNMRLSDDYVQPPRIIIEGAVPVKRDKWVIESIDWGDHVIWHEAGYRVRQDAVVHLLEYVEPQQLAIKPVTTSQIIHVKAGDTLKSLSREYYGTPKYWSAIKKANNLRDGKKLPGTLRIPPIVNPG